MSQSGRPSTRARKGDKKEIMKIIAERNDYKERNLSFSMALCGVIYRIVSDEMNGSAFDWQREIEHFIPWEDIQQIQGTDLNVAVVDDPENPGLKITIKKRDENDEGNT